MSFSIIYMVMNIGYLAAGWIFDYVRQVRFSLQHRRLRANTHQQLFIVSLAFEILLFPAIYFLRRSARRRDRRCSERRDMSERESWRPCGKVRSKRSSYFDRLIGQSGFLSFARLLPSSLDF